MQYMPPPPDRGESVAGYSDKQIIQVLVNSANNGREFELEDIVLAKTITLKGYTLFMNLGSAGTMGDFGLGLINDNIGKSHYVDTKGTIYVDIDWLKVNSVEGIQRHNMIALPWQWNDGASQDFMTNNMVLEYNLPLPTSTSIRKRFRPSVYYRDAAGVFNRLPLPAPHNQDFQLILYFEITHDHVFR